MRKKKEVQQGTLALMVLKTLDVLGSQHGYGLAKRIEQISADRLTLTYRFINHGAVDGLNFQTACARRLTFSGSMAGVKLPISRIWIGRANHHPLQNPFSVTRVS